ncbi:MULTISPECIES: hypothetical protein [Arthrobacter]|uniref:Uncharacterized protein n=1 Tax=Arthrobacter oryzae TaxID=409290 RepID=A0A3N0C5Y0_9MICC|nr:MULTISPECIES: hypothetical protein [Arthrobacter]RNL58344.1 hypothetical protein D7003_03980 [Arthrobacter oryzae]
MPESAIVDHESRQHVRSALATGDGIVREGADWTDFEEWFDRRFPELCKLFHGLYGVREDWLAQLTALVVQAARSWSERPAELKSLDAERATNPDWFQSDEMLCGEAQHSGGNRLDKLRSEPR